MIWRSRWKTTVCPPAEMREIVQKTAELVSVEGHLGYAPHELSGGLKQPGQVWRA
ncbi:MAG: hypothetical protein ACLUE8_02465 [Lachnospiraceae bacterium]